MWSALRFCLSVYFDLSPFIAGPPSEPEATHLALGWVLLLLVAKAVPVVGVVGGRGLGPRVRDAHPAAFGWRHWPGRQLAAVGAGRKTEGGPGCTIIRRGTAVP